MTFKLLVALVALGPISVFSALAADVDSVVTIYSKSGGSRSGQGTGFFIDSNGRIWTAYHVIQDSVELEAYDRNLNRIQNLRIERIDERRDLAILSSQPAISVLKLPLSGGAPPSFGNVHIAGSPRGLPQQVIHGRITSASYVKSTTISSAGGKRIFQENPDRWLDAFGGVLDKPR